MIISLERVFDKIQQSFPIKEKTKPLRKSGLERNLLNLLKVANILNDERLNVSPQRSGTRQGTSSLHLCNITLGVLASAIGKKMNKRHIVLERHKNVSILRQHEYLCRKSKRINNNNKKLVGQLREKVE